MQDQLIPNTDREDPRLGLQVVVSKGHLKGYRGRVTYVGSEFVNIELEAYMTGPNDPIRSFRWTDLG